MIRHVVHLSAQEGNTDVPPWEPSLEQAGFLVLRAKSLNQAKFYLKGYPVVGVLMEVADAQNGTQGQIRELLACESKNRFALIGLTSESLSPESQSTLAEAGLNSLFDPVAPGEFLIYQLRLNQTLLQLKALEESGMEIQTLCKETRKLLHDLSQPLAALQGRLQILELQSKPDDPLRETYHAMVGLSGQITDHLRQLHELHRKFS